MEILAVSEGLLVGVWMLPEGYLESVGMVYKLRREIKKKPEAEVVPSSSSVKF